MMNRKKLRKLGTVKKYVGGWYRCALVLRLMGIKKTLNALTMEELDRLYTRCRRRRYYIDLPANCMAFHRAEVVFGMSLLPHVEKMRKYGGVRVVKNLGGEMLPIVNVKRVAEKLRMQPRFTDVISLRQEEHLYFQVSDLYRYLREAGIEERVIRNWRGGKACCFDRESALGYLESLMMPGAKREGKISGMKGPRKLEKSQYGGWTIPKAALKKLELEKVPFCPVPW